MTAAPNVTTLSELLRDGGQRFARSEVVFPNERCTFAQMDRRADAFAAMLREAGVAAGDHVGIWIPPCIDTIGAIFGCFRAGAVAVPLSERFRAEEMAYVIEHADLTAVVTVLGDDVVDRPGDLVDALPGMRRATGPTLALDEAPKLARIVLVGHGDAPAAFTPAASLGLPAPGQFPHVDVPDPQAASEIAYLMYTSGTSAAPKACMISHGGCLLQGRSLAFDRYMLDEGSAFWCPLPLFHTAGLATLTACLTSGAAYVHAGAFEAGLALEMLERERVTHAIPAFETVWMRVLDHPRFASTDLSRLRVVLMTGGESLLRKLQARVPQAVQVTNFGMTEATGHLSMNCIDDPLDVRVTTGGHPLAQMEVRIVDPDTAAVVPSGTRGEIQFRGPSRFVGYYRDAEATAACLLPGGWFRSGDLGVLDPEDRLTFGGRLKDMLKVGGENVAALEVESYLVRHPAINVAAVVGAADAYYGEVPAAFVELAPGASLTEDEVIAFCVDEIATFKVPRYVRFVTEWPMSGTKIKKFVLREQLAEELSRAGITAAPRIESDRARRARLRT
jgi:fatty-acyl-CoA synthase